MEADLAARAQADLDDDVVKAGRAGVLGLDVALERVLIAAERLPPASSCARW